MAIIIAIICVVVGVFIHVVNDKAKQEEITKVASCYWDAPTNSVLEEAISKKYLRNWSFGGKSLFPKEYIDWFCRDSMAWAMWIRDQTTRELMAQGYRPSSIMQIGVYNKETYTVERIDVENYYFKGYKMKFEEEQRLIEQGLIDKNGIAK